MKLSHLLADDIRANREIEIITRRRQVDINSTTAPSTFRAFRTSTALHRLLLPAR